MPSGATIKKLCAERYLSLIPAEEFYSQELNIDKNIIGYANKNLRCLDIVLICE